MEALNSIPPKNYHRSSPLLDIAFLCGQTPLQHLKNSSSQSAIHFTTASQTEQHQFIPRKLDDTVPEIGYQWEATLDIHLGHKITYNGDCITIHWSPDWGFSEQSIHEFRVAVRWIIKDPSHPGEVRDCSNCLAGAHLRKFITDRNCTPFASFGGSDDEPALRLDTFGQTQIKQWCKDILKVDKKPKESYLCFDLVRLTPQNKLIIEKRNIVTYKTNLKGYRFSKNAVFQVSSSMSYKHSCSDISGPMILSNSTSKSDTVLPSALQANCRNRTATIERIDELTYYMEHLNECDAARCDPLRWEDFIAALKTYDTFCDNLLPKITHILGKVWVYKNDTFDYYVSWKSLRSAALWAGGSFSNFLKVVDGILKASTPSWLFKIDSSKREVFSKLHLQKDGAVAIRFCQHTPFTFHLMTKNENGIEGHTRFLIEVNFDRRNNKFLLRKVGTGSELNNLTQHCASHLDDWVSRCQQLLSDQSLHNSSSPELDSSDSNNPSPVRCSPHHGLLLYHQTDEFEPPSKKARFTDSSPLSS